MKTFHSLSDLKKITLDSTPAKPQVAGNPIKGGKTSGEVAAAVPKRTSHEEFAVLLGEAMPLTDRRGVGRKPAPATAIPEKPHEDPAREDRKPLEPRRPPIVRLVGPAGGQTLATGSATVLRPGETALVVEAEGAETVSVKLVVEKPAAKVPAPVPDRKLGLDAANREIDRLAGEVRRLQAERDDLRRKIDALRDAGRARVRIDVEEFFPGEAYEHVIEALAREATAAKAVNGRRAEILAAVLGGNPPATELPRRRQIVDEVLATARRPGPRELARLAEIGIREVSKNKHYKLGYGRHTQTLALTPSDHRGGQNAAADMKAKFF